MKAAVRQFTFLCSFILFCWVADGFQKRKRFQTLFERQQCAIIHGYTLEQTQLNELLSMPESAKFWSEN